MITSVDGSGQTQKHQGHFFKLDSNFVKFGREFPQNVFWGFLSSVTQNAFTRITSNS